MDAIVSSLGFKHSEALENYVKEKLEKLKPNDHIIRANVTFFQGPDRATKSDYCEIRLEVPGNDHFVKERAADFEQSIDEAVNKLQTMIRKTRDKMVDRQQGKITGSN